jgi:protein subunit release factor B
MEIPEDEIEFEFYRSSGPGGQKKNTTDSAVRARHIPTGITVVATAERSQLRNKQAAVEEIARRLAALRKKRIPRVPTRPSKASQARRVEAKKKRGLLKKLRGAQPE